MWEWLLKLSTVVGLLGGLLGLVSWIIGSSDRHRSRMLEIRRGPRHLTARFEPRIRRLDPAGYTGSVEGYEVVIVNEGPLPVTITSACLGDDPRPRSFLLADGTVATRAELDPRTPTYVRTYPLQLTGLDTYLRSGQELHVPVVDLPHRPPRDWNHEKIPQVTLVDIEGRKWLKCDTEFEELKEWTPGSLRTRRHSWFERQRWWPRLDQRMYRFAVRLTARHPSRPSLLVYTIDWLWGWRAGKFDPPPFPRNLPRSWPWAELALTNEQIQRLVHSPLDPIDAVESAPAVEPAIDRALAPPDNAGETAPN
jgi:hypothetical protein